MGCTMPSNSAESRLERAASFHIDHQIAELEKEDCMVEKLLLLGTQNSGKSTLFRQCRLQYGKGIPANERVHVYRPTIQRQAVNQMLRFAKACFERTHYASNDNEWSEQALHALSQLKEYSGHTMSHEQIDSVEVLWKEKDIRDAFIHSELPRKIGVPETSRFFWGDVGRVGDLDYEPTNQDCLFVRKRTQGIEQTTIFVQNKQLTIIDVDGHDSQRKKWFQYFDNVRAIIWVTSLMSCFESMDEYEYLDSYNVSDRLISKDYESPSGTNAMHDALKSFQETVNSEHVRNINVIMFLNKVDLFEKNFDVERFKTCFENYTGRDDWREALEFVQAEFEKRFENQSRRGVFVHSICCTDSEVFDRVFVDVQHVLINLSLHSTGLL